MWVLPLEPFLMVFGLAKRPFFFWGGGGLLKQILVDVGPFDGKNLTLLKQTP